MIYNKYMLNFNLPGLLEKTTDMSPVSDKLYHVVLTTPSISRDSNLQINNLIKLLRCLMINSKMLSSVTE